MISTLALMIQLNRKRSDMAHKHLEVTRLEYDLRLSQEKQCSHELRLHQDMLEARQKQLQQMLQHPVRSDNLLTENFHIQNLKVACHKSLLELKTAQAFTQQTSAEYSQAKAVFLKFITKMEACKSEYQKIQAEEIQRIEKKTEHELEDNFCKSTRSLS